MGFIRIIFQPIITFTIVASFSLFFMQIFLIAGILTTKIQRNVVAETDEMKHFRGYMMAAGLGFVAGVISLAALVFL